MEHGSRVARVLGLLAVLMIVAVGAACGDDGDDTLVLTDADSGSEVEVDGGASFEIHLESNPSTGYAWQPSEMTTPDLFTLESTDFVDPDTDLVGAAGTEIFVFRAADEGAGVLRLEYVRSFEDPVIPERVAEYVIRIDGAPWPPDGVVPPSVSTEEAP